MDQANDSGEQLPAHIDRTVRAIAALHAEHRQRENTVQRFVRRSVALIGRPRFVGILTLLIVGWIGANLLLGRYGRAFDPPPYPYLFDVGEALGIYITILILITQRRDDEVARLREQLALELAILAEQKNAKIIGLIEELRRDLPTVRDRIDREAALLSVPADPQAVLDAFAEREHALFSDDEP